ncbi:MAG TPA: oligogalacturonate lyase family protein [Opitutaceae bacterium]|nr:oligogalacturonate lyase family protein [Opitutaceae bacterium]
MKSPRLLPRLLLALAAASAARAQEGAAAPPPPKSWIDPDTGHRVIRLSDVPGSESFYFNFNAYTPDGTRMIYTTPDGIQVLDLRTFQSRPLVKEVKRAIVVGAKTPTIYFSKRIDDYHTSLWKADIDTGEVRKIADLPRRATVYTINADETLGAGDFIEGDANAGGAYDGTPQANRFQMGKNNIGEPANKSELMTQRFNAKLPMSVFTIDLRTGKITYLLRHVTDWIDHEQFSPKDPTLLLYAHEGHWQLVDRMWTIRTDGTGNQLLHKRTMKMEIAGHEWWDLRGQIVWYQLHLPWHVANASYVAGYNVVTHERTWYHYSADADSIHHNSSPDGTLFCGDGNRDNPWIVLCRPVPVPDEHTLGENLINSGYLQVERLVNMGRTALHGAQNYRLEPNPSFTPDMKYVIFRSNIFGPDYPFAVEVAKAAQP